MGIDRVKFSGWNGYMELFVIDLDHMQLAVDDRDFFLSEQGQSRPWNTRQRFKARQHLECEKNEKWHEDIMMVDLFHRDADIASMRFPYTLEFVYVFNMGFQNYAEGEWEVARGTLERTSAMLGVQDGPSLALLEFMAKYPFKAPTEWTGVREMTREEIEHGGDRA